jgi:hypothetical protein
MPDQAQAEDLLAKKNIDHVETHAVRHMGAFAIPFLGHSVTLPATPEPA